MSSIRAYPMKTNADIPADTARMGKRKSFSLSASLIRRFRYFILETEWDKNLLKYERWIDMLCWTIIVASVLFFLPVTLSEVWK